MSRAIPAFARMTSGAGPQGRRNASRRATPAAAVLAAMLFLTAWSAAAGDLTFEVTDAWVTEPPPGSTLAAAYLTIANRDNRARVLERVTSPDVARIELHRSELVDGLARMREVEAIELPAGATTRLAPGGYHLMLHVEGARPRAGEALVLELHFDGGESLAVTAQVRRRGAGANHHHP